MHVPSIRLRLVTSGHTDLAQSFRLWPTMPSLFNPNTPSSSKRKSAHVLKAKRQSRQRQAHNKVTKQLPARTSQALRKSAPLSKKKARKLERKRGYAKQREELSEYFLADVEMKDVADKRKKQLSVQADGAVPMELDQAK